MSNLNPHFSDIEQRRQFSSTIQQLNNSCENLYRIRDELYSRIGELNYFADKIIYDKVVTVSPPEIPSDTTSHVHKQRLFTSSLRETDEKNPNKSKVFFNEPMISNNNRPNDNPSLITQRSDRQNNSRATRSQINDRGPSDEFKIQLAHCLREVESKIEAIDKLVNQISDL